MTTAPTTPACITQTTPQLFSLSGSWTTLCISNALTQLGALPTGATEAPHANCAGIQALDSIGAWALHKLLKQLGTDHAKATLDGLKPEWRKLFDSAAPPDTLGKIAAPPGLKPLEQVGASAIDAARQMRDLLAFVGEITLALGTAIAQPRRIRWRPVLYNIRSAGFNALPIVGMLSLLLGIVVAYQGADQLRRYGASIFVADLVGLSMLREFAPLITAIIVAGRSGSAYAAQIGTMVVTEEIDAMRTIGIAPLELLVLPKLAALIIALPLLTAFADVLGVFGGMIMARAQLGIGFVEFLDRFVKAVSVTTYLLGIGKAPVFAAVIVVVGCFQGFRTSGGADSVGQHTTRSVVQSIFLVIVADALFSVAFSALGL